MKYPIIAERINEIMQRRGISQRKLAKMSGLSELTIRFYQQGKHRPTIQSAISMSKVLNVEPDYLTGEEYKQEEPNQTKENQFNYIQLKCISLDTFLDLYYDQTRIIVLCEEESREELQEDYCGELQDGTIQFGTIENHIITAFFPYNTNCEPYCYLNEKLLNSDVTGFSIGKDYLLIWVNYMG